jgi:hypothetical protein
MLNPLAAQAVATVVSRKHNARDYEARGCEELDSRYRALVRQIKKPLETWGTGDPEELYNGLVREIESDPKFAAKLEALYNGDFPTKFGQLVTKVLAQWDRLEEPQLELVKDARLWIPAATKAWKESFRVDMNPYLDHVAYRLYLFTNVWLLRRFARILDPQALDAAAEYFPGMAFSSVQDEELEEVARRREAVNGLDSLRGRVPPAREAGCPQQRADASNLAGLAFSGGGIRSATFNLGVLQFLGDKGLLRRFDYLSTVSGGGYIGSWLHAWIRHGDQTDGGQKQDEPRGIDRVENSLKPANVPEAGPVRFLRRYSNYLTPQTGAMSADTWTMLNIWMRNTFLNMLILTLALSALLLTPGWLASIADRLDHTAPATVIGALTGGRVAGAAAKVAAEENRGGITDYWWVLLIPSACLIGLNLAGLRSQSKPGKVLAWLRREQAILALVVAPIFLGGWLAGTVVPNDMKQLPIHDKYVRAEKKVAELARARGAYSSQAQWESAVTAQRQELAALAGELDRALDGIFEQDSFQFGWVTAMLVLVVSITGRLDRNFYPRRASDGWIRRALTIGRAYGWVALVCLMAAIASGGLDYFWLDHVAKPLWAAHSDRLVGPREILTGSAPVFLSLLSIAVFLYMGLLGRRFSDDRREWMARLGAWLTICCIAWVAVCGTATFGPWLLHRIAAAAQTSDIWGTGEVGVGWMLVTAAGLYAGRSVGKDNKSGSFTKAIAVLAPPLFVAGLLLLLAEALSRFAPAGGWEAFAMTAFCGGMALFLSRRVDINEFSLHQFYRNRLVRCYLGGARGAERRPDRFTGFDGRDDFPVQDLTPTRPDGAPGYFGPYPIFNTTLNVSHGEELAWQERKGEAFVFTPRFSGFDVAHGRATHLRTKDQPKLSSGGYRPTRCYAYPENGGVNVGTAVAISGAAASPNQGTRTNASTAFLMTVLDVRLGWWLGNPRRNDTWQKPGPTTGLFQLLAELTGSTSDTGKYVYLSDGGHFENLAIYELVRRRCRFIVACDSEEDHTYTFGGLGNVIRKCRTDFGAEITIDVGDLKPPPDGRFTRSHYAVGKIGYPADEKGPAAEGTLIYIKSSLTGNDESADVLQFAMMYREFPHESTANQWFDETRFESYRRLGYHVAESAITGANAEAAALFGDLLQEPREKAAMAAAG